MAEESFPHSDNGVSLGWDHDDRVEILACPEQRDRATSGVGARNDTKKLATMLALAFQVGGHLFQ